MKTIFQYFFSLSVVFFHFFLLPEFAWCLSCKDFSNIDPSFDFTACELEQKKTLTPIDYKSLYLKSEGKPWNHKTIELNTRESCQKFIAQAYTTDEIPEFLPAIASQESTLEASPSFISHATSQDSKPEDSKAQDLASMSRVAKAKNKKKKNSCRLMILNERIILANLNRLFRNKANESSVVYAAEFIRKKISEHEKTLWPSDIALQLAYQLQAQEFSTLALSCFELVFSSPRVIIDDASVFSATFPFIEHYNQNILNQGAQDPSPESYVSLNAALKVIEKAPLQSDDSKNLSQKLTQQLKSMRDLLIRWPISVQKVLNDPFFEKYALGRLIYHKDFTENLVSDLAGFQDIFQATDYVGRPGCEGPILKHDLADALFEAGFYGSSNPNYYSEPKHIWGHPKGYTVRIKKPSFTSDWEFTLGLTYINPFDWEYSRPEGRMVSNGRINVAPLLKKNGGKSGYYKLLQLIKESNPLNSALDSEPIYLMDYQYNEIFKVAVDSVGKITLMPAFHEIPSEKVLNKISSSFTYFPLDYWEDRSSSGDELNRAHFPLTGKVQMTHVEKNGYL